MPSIKRVVEDMLFRIPGVYARFYRSRENWNLDKYLFLQLIRPGFTVLDGGANVGHYTFLFSKIAGSHGAVYCFEPTPPTFQQLQGNVKTWGLKNTVLVNQGLGEEPGQMDIHLPGGVSGYASLAAHPDTWGDAAIETFDVGIIRLDDYWKGVGRKLDFVKLDLEGAEPLAASGAKSTLAKWLPSLHIEFSPSFMKSFNRDGTDLLKGLAGIGYDAFLGFTDKVTRPVPLEIPFLGLPPGGYTLVCLNRVKHAKELAALARW